MEREDKAAMHAMLGLPSDMQVWEMQEQRQRSKYLSASMTHANAKQRNICTRCGREYCDPVSCPFAPYNLLKV